MVGGGWDKFPYFSLFKLSTALWSSKPKKVNTIFHLLGGLKEMENSMGEDQYMM